MGKKDKEQHDEDPATTARWEDDRLEGEIADAGFQQREDLDTTLTWEKGKK